MILLTLLAVQCLAWRVQEDWPEAQRQFKVLLGQGSRLRAPIVTVNTIMSAYMKQGMYTQVRHLALHVVCTRS